MYADDAPEREGAAHEPALRRDLLRELVFSSRLRPRVPPAVAAELRAKLQRTAPGYAPRDGNELLDWVGERLLLPAGEWQELLVAIDRDRREKGDEPVAQGMAAAMSARAVAVRLPGAACPAVAALEALPRLAAALGVEGGARGLAVASLLDPDRAAPAEALGNFERLLAAWEEPAPGRSRETLAEVSELEAEAAAEDPLPELLGEWLRFYGPLDRGYLAEVFGFEPEGKDARLAAALEALVEEERVVVDEELVVGEAGLQVCDTVNLETLLRWARAAARPAFEALPIERLPLFLASHQGVALTPSLSRGERE
jgi:ATP-dependent Lhr-like helicase